MKFISAYTLLVIILVFNYGTSSGDISETVNATQLSRYDAEKDGDRYSVCGGVYIQKQFVLVSPNYPEYYPPNLECHYLLKGPHCVTYYTFEFLDFDLQNSVGCGKDALEIEEQEALCGNENKTKMYISKNGSLHVKFKTDEGISGRGYKIQVTRMACDRRGSEEEETTTGNFGTEEMTTEYFETTTTTSFMETVTQPVIQSRNLPSFATSQSECCTNNYNAKRFVLTSPNFPYTLNKKTECIYRIRKANDNVCRLRLNFLVFWLGYLNFNNYCPYGHLEIDGKYICGCNKELKLITTFGDSDVKILKFQTDGFLQNYNTGFVLEVTQDECPKKYSPENLNRASSNSSDEFRIYNDQISRVAWPSDTQQELIQKLRLINERTEILDDDVYFPRGTPPIVKSVYVFAAPEYNDIPPFIVDKEKTTYIETSSVDSITTNTNYDECLSWNRINFNDLYTRYGQTLEQTCMTKEDNEASTDSGDNCVELNYISGYFKSTGYPCYYPGNLNACYRFRKQPGYCAIRMFVNDFQIENSYNCLKDYVLLTNGYKYCGNSLFKASWTIDLRNKDYEDMRFVTDAYHCGRGFSGLYQQIACEDSYPTKPSTSTEIPTTSRPIYCDRVIKDKEFAIVLNQDHEKCTFRFRKSSKDVCKINFYFEKFDLFCAVESLIIDGMMFCGHLTGRVVTMNLNKDAKDIVYRSTLEHKYDELRFRIRGEQISDDCLLPEVPAERLINLKSINPQINFDESLTAGESSTSDINSVYKRAQLNKQFKDICGIVSNTPEKELPSSFCDTLIKKHNATKCVALQEESNVISDVPLEKRKYEVKVMNAEKIEEINGIAFHEIDCDKFN